MTPYELAQSVHRELASTAPRLAAAVNRALLDIGEGSPLVGLGPGTHQDDPVSFQEGETIALGGASAAAVLVKLTEIASFVENNSGWQVVIERRKSERSDRLELMYTLVRTPRQGLKIGD